MSAPARVLLCALLSFSVAACARGSAGGDDDGDRGTDEDAGTVVKPPPPPGTNPDAAVVEVVPDASPEEVIDASCPVQTVDLLVNGNFDSSPGGGWVESSVAGLRIIVEEGSPEFPDGLVVPADSGTVLAYMAGYNEALDEIHQDVTIPEDATGLRLRGVGRVDTAETSAVTPLDNVFLEIQTPAGERLEELARFTNLDATGGIYGPFERRARGNYQGQKVRIQIRATTDESLRTHFFFDTLALEVGTCSSGTGGLLP